MKSMSLTGTPKTGRNAWPSEASPVRGIFILGDMMEKAIKYWVYLVWIIGTKIYKIGISNNPKNRLAGIDRGLPFGVSLDALSMAYDRESALSAEKNIHRALDRCRIREKREWFLLTDKQAASVRILLEEGIDFSDDPLFGYTLQGLYKNVKVRPISDRPNKRKRKKTRKRALDHFNQAIKNAFKEDFKMRWGSHRSRGAKE